MLELRKKLANYQEIFYMLFLLPMTGMTSMGLNSEDRIYLYVFAVATLFLLLKMAVTDFTWKEIVIMGVLTILFGVNFLRNGEKTLILTVMAIFGAKNVNLDKVMKYALWEKAVLTVGTLTLAATGVIENEELWLPKNGGEMVYVYSYGYYSANMAYANIFVILLLIIMVYQDKLKWYAYILGTIISFGAYKILICRTGLLLWGVLCIMILGYKIAKHMKKERLYMNLFLCIPALATMCTMILPIATRKSQVFNEWINKLLNYRITNINEVYNLIWKLWIGSVSPKVFDSMYFTLLYNYGWILFFLSLVAYISGMWYCNKKEQYCVTIALGIMAVYGFMELLPLSILWNLPLIYLAQVLFKERTVVHEQLQ